MIRFVHEEVWAFDAEWVPDVRAGRLLLGLSNELQEEEVFSRMWEAAGADETNPRPYLKTAHCKVVSISAVVRTKKSGETDLSLRSLPKLSDGEAEESEPEIIASFLETVGKRRPQLVGFNSVNADLKIMLQRAVFTGAQLPEFSKRPNKPWEGADYFSKASDFNVDLMDVLGGWGSQSVSLNDAAVLSGIPGKMDVSGAQVADLYLAGELERIIAYNELDALTTYLLWLRVAHSAGHFSEAEYVFEQELVQRLLEAESASKPWLLEFNEKWQEFRSFSEESARISS